MTVAVGRQSAGRQAGRQTCPAGKQQGTRLFVPQQIIPAPHAVAPHHLRPRSSRVCGHEVQAGQLSSWNRSSARVCPQLSNPSPRGQLCTATGMLAVTCRRACTSTQRSASNRPGWLVKAPCQLTFGASTAHSAPMSCALIAATYLSTVRCSCSSLWRHVGASAQRSAPGLPGAAAAAAAVAAAPASGAAAGRLDTSHRCKVWQRFSSAAIDQLAAWQVEQRQAAAAAASPLAGEALTAVGVSSPGKQLPQRWGVPQPAAHRHIARCRSARRRTQPSRRDRSAADCLSHIGDLQTTSCAVGNLCQERESGPACRRQGMLVRGSDE